MSSSKEEDKKDDEEEVEVEEPLPPAKFGNFPSETIFLRYYKSYDRRDIVVHLKRPKYENDPDQTKYMSWFYLHKNFDKDIKDVPEKLEIKEETELVITFDVCELTFNDYYRTACQLRMFSTYDEDLDEGEDEFNIYLQALTRGDDNSWLVRDCEKVWNMPIGGY